MQVWLQYELYFIHRWADQGKKKKKHPHHSTPSLPTFCSPLTLLLLLRQWFASCLSKAHAEPHACFTILSIYLHFCSFSLALFLSLLSSLPLQTFMHLWIAANQWESELLLTMLSFTPHQEVSLRDRHFKAASMLFVASNLSFRQRKTSYRYPSMLWAPQTTRCLK